MNVRAPYPQRSWLVTAVALGAGVVLGAALRRADQQQYAALGWIGAVLGGVGCFLFPFVSTQRWRAAFARGQMLVFMIGFALLDQVRRGHFHYPRAEGLLFLGGGLAACAVLMKWDTATRPRQRLALLTDAGLLENSDVPDLLTRYLAHLERVREETREDAVRIKRLVKDVSRGRIKDAHQMRELVAALDRIETACAAGRPFELEPLSDLDRAGLKRYREFCLGQGQRAWHEAIAILARHHRVRLPAWLVAERRRLARSFIL